MSPRCAAMAPSSPSSPLAHGPLHPPECPFADVPTEGLPFVADPPGEKESCRGGPRPSPGGDLHGCRIGVLCLVIRLKRQRVPSFIRLPRGTETARWWRRRTRGRRVAEVPMDAEVVTGRVRAGRRGGVYPVMRVRRRGIHGGGVLTWGWREDGGELGWLRSGPRRRGGGASDGWTLEGSVSSSRAPGASSSSSTSTTSPR